MAETQTIEKQGPIGRDGMNGKDGLNGVNGKDGKDGRDGKDCTPEMIDDAVAKQFSKALKKALGLPLWVLIALGVAVPILIGIAALLKP